jgi:hypothetical protein
VQFLRTRESSFFAIGEITFAGIGELPIAKEAYGKNDCLVRSDNIPAPGQMSSVLCFLLSRNGLHSKKNVLFFGNCEILIILYMSEKQSRIRDGGW